MNPSFFFKVNDWPCNAALSVLCIRERSIRIPEVTSIEFTPTIWSRAVELNHCQPIRNFAKWMSPRCSKHVPGGPTCNSKYLHIATKAETTDTNVAISRRPNCVFYPPSAYSCKRWTQKTLREDLMKARRATKSIR